MFKSYCYGVGYLIPIILVVERLRQGHYPECEENLSDRLCRTTKWDPITNKQTKPLLCKPDRIMKGEAPHFISHIHSHLKNIISSTMSTTSPPNYGRSQTIQQIRIIYRYWHGTHLDCRKTNGHRFVPCNTSSFSFVVFPSLAIPDQLFLFFFLKQEMPVRASIGSLARELSPFPLPR